MGVFAVFSDNNYEGPSRLIRSTEHLSRPPIGTHGSVWAHAVMWGKKKKTWTGFPEPLHKPRDRQEIHFCRMQLQPCWFCEKSSFFIYHQGHGRAEVVRTLTARFMGQSNCFSLKHAITVTHSHYCACMCTQIPTYTVSTLSQERHKYKQFLDNNTRTHNLVKDAY